MSFQDLGLSPVLLRAIETQGFTSPTPIQTAAIPPILDGQDVMASAPTGTGKTAAFALPILQRLFTDKQRHSKRPRALILTPTRELAAQVHANVRDCGKGLPMHSTTIFGGVSMHGQLKALRRGVDLIVATPGRLLDHLQQGTVNLGGVEILVLDEADRMLDMGFRPALQKLVAALPKQRQTLLFSATFAGPIKTLAAQFLNDPKKIQVTPPNSVTTTVTHRVHPVDAGRKRDLLLHVLAEDERRQALVFCRTKRGCDNQVRFLEKYGLRAIAIHGNKSQNKRTRALREFKNGRFTVLVATDIAARGLDIEQLPLVINHDLPMVAEDYIHRIGRTGRAGASGLAVSLVTHEEAGLLRDIQKLLKNPIAIAPVPGFEPDKPLQLDKNTPSRRQSRGNNARKGNNHRPHGQKRRRPRGNNNTRPQGNQRHRTSARSNNR